MAEIGWQKIGEIADVIGKGIERTLQELREILNRAGEAARNQLDRIENFVRDVFRAQESEESEEQEGEQEQSEAKPSKADCNKAIKLLTDYKRLYEKAGGRPTRQQIERWNALRDAETITSNGLPGSIQREFPGSLRGRTLGEIRKLCGKQR